MKMYRRRINMQRPASWTGSVPRDPAPATAFESVPAPGAGWVPLWSRSAERGAGRGRQTPRAQTDTQRAAKTHKSKRERRRQAPETQSRAGWVRDRQPARLELASTLAAAQARPSARVWWVRLGGGRTVLGARVCSARALRWGSSRCSPGLSCSCGSLHRHRALDPGAACAREQLLSRPLSYGTCPPAPTPHAARLVPSVAARSCPGGVCAHGVPGLCFRPARRVCADISCPRLRHRPGPRGHPSPCCSPGHPQAQDCRGVVQTAFCPGLPAGDAHVSPPLALQFNRYAWFSHKQPITPEPPQSPAATSALGRGPDLVRGRGPAA